MNHFEGKFVYIDYDPDLQRPVHFTRRSTGQKVTYEGKDINDWVNQMIRDRLKIEALRHANAVADRMEVSKRIAVELGRRTGDHE